MSRDSTRVRPAGTVGDGRIPQAWRCLAKFLQVPSIVFFIGAAAAQTASGPIIDGRRPQPTQSQIDRSEDSAARRWNDTVQPEVDRLYDEIIRASRPKTR